MTTTQTTEATKATEAHRYVAEKSGWKTCQVCGRGANASIHRKAS